MILNLFMFFCSVCLVVFYHGLCSDACILKCNECIYLLVVGMVHSLLFFIASISHALGLHRFYPICSNEYKDKDEGGGLDIPPYPMKTDLVTMWQKDNIVVSRDKAIVGMPQRRFS